jgi:hypothetical protein
MDYLVEHQNDAYLELDDGYIPREDSPSRSGLVEQKPRRLSGYARTNGKEKSDASSLQSSGNQ